MRGVAERRSGWVVLGLLVAAQVATAVPSKYVKQKALKAPDEMTKEAQAVFSRYDTLKENDLLNEGDDGYTGAVKIAQQLRSIFNGGLDKYREAVDTEGWPADDPEIVALRGRLDELRQKFEQYAMWTCFRFEDPKAEPDAISRLDTIRETAWAAANLKQAGKVDDATGMFESVGKRLQGLQQEMKQRLLDGGTPAISPKHPAIQRATDSIAALQHRQSAAADALGGQRQAVEETYQALCGLAELLKPVSDAMYQIANQHETRQAAIDAYGKLMPAIDTYAVQVKPQAETLLAKVAAEYGTDSIEIQNKTNQIMGRDPGWNPDFSFVYNQVKDAMREVVEIPRDRAQLLLEETKRTLDDIDRFAEDVRLETMKEQKAFLQIACRLDPTNQQAKEMLSKIDDQIAAMAKQIEADFEARTWGPHLANFQGPGNAAELAKSYLKWIRGNGYDTKDKDALAVRVVGDWEVLQRNLLGQPLRYGLPVLVAYQRHSDKAAGNDVAVVFFVSAATSGPQMAPPWWGGAVADNWKMRVSKIQRME